MEKNTENYIKIIWKLVDNLAEGLHKNKCLDWKSCLKYIKIEDTHLIFKCLKCNKNHKKYFNKD